MNGILRDEGRPAVRFVKWLAACLAALVVAPAAASAALTVNDDAEGAGPAGSNCAAADHTRIEAAVAAAPVGETILVCTGTYTEPDNQILIEKSVSIIGNGPGSSIIDGQGATGLPSNGLIRMTDNNNGDVLVEGFTVRNAGQVGTGATTARFAIAPKGNDADTTLEFVNLAIEGRGEGGRDYGFYADNADNDVILRDSTVTGTDFNPVLIERVDGAVTVSGNTITPHPVTPSTPIFAFAHSNDHVSKALRIADNTIDASGTSGIAVQTGLPNGAALPANLSPVTVSGNVVQNYATTGIAVTNTSATADGLNGEITDVEISDNQLVTGPPLAVSPPPQVGLRVRGLVSDVTITGNDLREADTGISAVPFAPSGHTPTGITASFNRITGNTTGLENSTGGVIAAENNWWGCNAGPAGAGCDPVVNAGAATTDADPWLVLTAQATPDSIQTGGETASFAVSLRDNSAGETPLGIEQLPGPFAVDLSTTLGTIDPPELFLGDDLTGTATLTSGAAAGTATLTAALDNATSTDTVELAAPPVDPPVPGPGAAKLGLTATPVKKKVAPGRKLKLDTTTTNSGGSAATNVRICVKAPKKLRVKKRCRNLGTVAAGAGADARFKVKAKRSAPKRRYKLKLTASADGLAAVKTKVRIRVK